MLIKTRIVFVLSFCSILNACGGGGGGGGNNNSTYTNVAPAFTVSPIDQAVTENEVATFTVNVSGTPTPAIQWQFSSDGGTTFDNVTTGIGVTTNTYSTDTTDLTMNGWLYRAVATNSEGGANSSAAMLTVSVAVPEVPTLTLTPQTIKRFHFSWSDVSGESEYRLLENPDGISGYSTIATLAADEEQYNLPVALFEKINASYILQACNGGGCSDSSEIFTDNSIAQAAGYFKASNTEQTDHFGSKVSVSGDGSTMVVAATGEDSGASGVNGNQDDNSQDDSGAVYVFFNSGSTWVQEAYLKPSNTDSLDGFGSALALSENGNTLAVGSPNEDSSAVGIDGDESDNATSASGAVYVFVRSSNTWSQQAYVKASNTDFPDRFGRALALSVDGNTLAVGAPLESSDSIGVDGDQTNSGANFSGAVYVFSRTGSTWLQTNYIKSSNSEAGDNFGNSISLALNGKVLAVAANQEESNATGVNGDQNNNLLAGSGAVYLFSRIGVSWIQNAYIKASNPDANDFFGTAIALSEDGNTLVVSAPNESSSATGINGNDLDNIATNAGAVYVFVNDGVSWAQQAFIKASNTDAQDQFGISLAITDDGSTLAVGSYLEDSDATFLNGSESNSKEADSGAVYLFKRDASEWSQYSYIKATNAEFEDNFGISVDISGLGEKLAVGGRGESSQSVGIGNDQNNNLAAESGAVYVY